VRGGAVTIDLGEYGYRTDPAPIALDFWEAPDGTTDLVALRPGGELVRSDLGDGNVVAGVATPYQDPLVVQVVGDLVVISAPEGMAAYDVATLEPRWQRPDGFGALPCGRLVCVQVGGTWAGPVAYSVALEAIDPTTGARRWSAACPDSAGMQECLLTVDELGSGDRLLIQQRFGRDPGDPLGFFWVVDAGTGRRLTEPAQWLVMGPAAGGWLLTTDIRPAGDGPGRHWFARSGPDLERIEVLGEIEATSCQAHYPYVACRTPGEPPQVWRIR
jgi:hypothetical protein